MTSPASAASAPRALVIRSTRIDDPGDLVGLLPAPDGHVWMRRGEGLVGWGSAARLEVAGGNRFEAAAEWWDQVVAAAVVRDEVCLPGSGAVCFGSFGFNDDCPSVLVVPEVVVGRQGDHAWVTTLSAADQLAPPPKLWRQRFESIGQVRYADGAQSPADWQRTISDAVKRIATGDLEKVVLALDLIAQADRPIDPRVLLARLSERYPGCWTFAVDGLIGATPEMLVRREKGLLTSRVLAGTIRRTGDDRHDLALAAGLARSSKDLEEHELAVRSVAEALAAHCTSMNLPEAPFVLHLPNVMHLASDVAGVAADDASSLRLAAALHPSAAVCGTPTVAARDLIGEIEHLDRGRYAGPVGWMDAAGDGEWGIALRCGQLEPRDPRRIRLFAGCGIVAGSDPEAELAEAAAKLVPMRDALQP